MNTFIVIGIALYCIIALKEMAHSLILGSMHHEKGFRAVFIPILEGVLWPLTIAWRISNRK